METVLPPVDVTTTTSKPFNRTPYIVIAIVSIAIIIIWIVTLYWMYYANSGIFGGNTERPVPDDPDLIPVNGEIIELTDEEKATLNIKVQQALNNLAAA